LAKVCSATIPAGHPSILKHDPVLHLKKNGRANLGAIIGLLA
jgi:hypothetical protein